LDTKFRLCFYVFVTPKFHGIYIKHYIYNVFKNTKKQFPSVWVSENPRYGNISLIKGTTHEAVVGGANAIKYEATGLYESINYVVAHGYYIYQFVGMYSNKDSALYRDFEPVVAVVSFIPAIGQH